MLPQTVVLWFFLQCVVVLHVHATPIEEESLLDKQARSAFIADWHESYKSHRLTLTETEILNAILQNATQMYVGGVHLSIGECLNQIETQLHLLYLHRIVEGVLEYTEANPCDNTIRFQQRMTKKSVDGWITLVNGVVFVPPNDKPKSVKTGGDLCAVADTVLYSIPAIGWESFMEIITSGIHYTSIH